MADPAWGGVAALPFGALAVGVVVLVAKAWAVRSEASKRAREHEVGGFEGLTPSEVAGVQDQFESELPPDLLIATLADALRARGGRVVHETGTELVAFTGNANQSKVDGMLKTPAEAMPVRIGLRARAIGEGSAVEVVIDEDYGFQMFVGPVRRAFEAKYLEALHLWLERVRGAA